MDGLVYAGAVESRLLFAFIGSWAVSRYGKSMTAIPQRSPLPFPSSYHHERPHHRGLAIPKPRSVPSRGAANTRTCIILSRLLLFHDA